MSEQSHLKWSAGLLSDIYSGSKFEPYDNPMNYVFADSTYCHCLVSVISLIYLVILKRTIFIYGGITGILYVMVTKPMWRFG